MVHSLSPFLVQFSDNFGIRWYGTAYLAGFLFGYLLITWLSERQNAGLSRALVGDFVTTIAIGTLVGGRIGYALFYSPDLFLKFKPDFPYWGLLAVNEGGMASHGGMIGIVAACLFFARRYRINSLYLLDLVCVAGPIGVFFGRIANFINGELVGRIAQPGFPLGVKFPQDMWLWPNSDTGRLGPLADATEKIGVSRESWFAWVDKVNSDSLSRQNIYDTISKLITEIQHGNTAVRDAVAPLLDLRHPSQLYEACGEGLFLFLLLFFLWRRPKKPGFICSTFIVSYAIVRIIGEQFRMPDAHIGYQALGLTRGQWLSAAMLVIGLALMFIWNRAGSLQINGWGRGQSIRLHRK
jgi:phosphatidylglycerol---prolipoprotein diacylglyceryl transferase